MKCQKCKYILPDDSEFCQYCGSKLSVDNENISVADKQIAELPNSTNVQQQSQVSLRASNTDEILRSQKESESTIRDIVSESDPNSIVLTAVSSEPSIDNQKKKFCKFCGGRIDAKTKKCSSCGKQYFRFQKRIAGIIVLVIVFVALAGFNIYQFVSISALEQQIESNNTTITGLEQQIKTKNSTISTQKTKISNLENNIEDLEIENISNSLELNFFESFAVIVADNGTRMYHTYGCEDLDGYDFWIFNVEAAEQKDYYACPYCH